MFCFFVAPKLCAEPAQFISVFVDKKKHLMLFLEEIIRVSEGGREGGREEGRKEGRREGGKEGLSPTVKF